VTATHPGEHLAEEPLSRKPFDRHGCIHLPGMGQTPRPFSRHGKSASLYHGLGQALSPSGRTLSPATCTPTAGTFPAVSPADEL